MDFMQENKHFKENKRFLAEIFSLAEIAKQRGHDMTIYWYSHVLSMDVYFYENSWQKSEDPTFKKVFRLGGQPGDVSREFRAFKSKVLMKIYGEKPVEVFESIISDMSLSVKLMKDDGITVDRKDHVASLATMLLDVLCVT